MCTSIYHRPEGLPLTACGLLAAPVPTTPTEEDEGAQDRVSPFPLRSAKSPIEEVLLSPQQALLPRRPAAVLDYGVDIAGRKPHPGGQKGGDTVCLPHSGPTAAETLTAIRAGSCPPVHGPQRRKERLRPSLSLRLGDAWCEGTGRTLRGGHTWACTLGGTHSPASKGACKVRNRAVSTLPGSVRVPWDRGSFAARRRQFPGLAAGAPELHVSPAPAEAVNG